MNKYGLTLKGHCFYNTFPRLYWSFMTKLRDNNPPNGWTITWHVALENVLRSDSLKRISKIEMKYLFNGLKCRDNCHWIYQNNDLVLWWQTYVNSCRKVQPEKYNLALWVHTQCHFNCKDPCNTANCFFSVFKKLDVRKKQFWLISSFLFQKGPW